MFLVYIFSFLNVCMLITGVIYSIIDVNRYSFGLYLILISIVIGSLLVAMCVLKPDCCATPRCLRSIYCRLTKPTLADSSACGGDQEAVNRLIIDQGGGGVMVEDPFRVLQTMRAIPMLIHAIQFSMETYSTSPPPSLPATPVTKNVELSSGFVDMPTVTQSSRGSVYTIAHDPDSWVELEGSSHIYHPKMKLAVLRRQSSAHGHGVFPLTEASQYSHYKATHLATAGQMSPPGGPDASGFQPKFGQLFPWPEAKSTASSVQKSSSASDLYGDNSL